MVRVSFNDYHELAAVLGVLKDRGDLPGTMLDALALAFKEIGMEEISDKVFALAESVWDDHATRELSR